MSNLKLRSYEKPKELFGSSYGMQKIDDTLICTIFNEGDFKGVDPHIEVYSVSYAKELIELLELYVGIIESNKG